MTVHVVGASFATSSALRGALMTALGEPVVLHGVSGSTLSRWSAGIPAPGAWTNDLVLVLEFGGNGIPTPTAVSEADVKLRATGARSVVWATFAGWPENATRFARERARDAIVAAGVARVTVPTPTDLAADGAHLTARGYVMLATQLASEVATRVTTASALPIVGVLTVLGSLAFLAFVWCTK